MDITIRTFFQLLRMGTFGEEAQMPPLSAWKWKKIYNWGVQHQVSALLYDGLCQCRDQFFVQLPDGLMEQWALSAQKTEELNAKENEALEQLMNALNQRQLRPILLNGQAMASLYNSPSHHEPDGINVFFPFHTQGHKADLWAEEHGTDLNYSEKYAFSYQFANTKVVNRHRMNLLTNKLNNHALQQIIEREFLESQTNLIDLNHQRMETLPPNLFLLHLLLNMALSIINEGVTVKQLTDIGVFLRKWGDRVDYIKLQEWIERLNLGSMAKLTALMLTNLLGFTDDEIPFVSESQKIKTTPTLMEELFALQTLSQRADGGTLSKRAPSQAVGQLRRTTRYMSFYPSEGFTNLLAVFAHSLSHIEE